MARFCVDYTFHGRTTETIEAASLEEAQAQIEAKVEDDNFDPGTDEIDDVSFNIQEMHPITRDGRELWTTYVRTGDVRGHVSALKGTLFAQEAALGAVA